MVESKPSPQRRARIAVSTHWTELRLAAQAKSARPDARAAFHAFCSRYYSAVYSLIRWRYPEPEAQDLTQEFFARRILRCDELEGLSPEKGRFRAWLHKVLERFLLDYARRRKHARLEQEFDEQEVPGKLVDPIEYEHLYARALADRALEAVHARWSVMLERRGALVDKRTLMTWLIDRDSNAIAAALGIKPDNARQNISRLHMDLWKALEAEVAETVADDATFASELREICRILRLTPPECDA